MQKKQGFETLPSKKEDPGRAKGAGAPPHYISGLWRTITPSTI